MPADVTLEILLKLMTSSGPRPGDGVERGREPARLGPSPILLTSRILPRVSLCSRLATRCGAASSRPPSSPQRKGRRSRPLQHLQAGNMLVFAGSRARRATVLLIGEAAVAVGAGRCWRPRRRQ